MRVEDPSAWEATVEHEVQKDASCNSKVSRKLFTEVGQNLYGAMGPKIQIEVIHCVLFSIGHFSSRSYLGAEQSGMP